MKPHSLCQLPHIRSYIAQISLLNSRSFPATSWTVTCHISTLDSAPPNGDVTSYSTTCVLFLVLNPLDEARFLRSKRKQSHSFYAGISLFSKTRGHSSLVQDALYTREGLYELYAAAVSEAMIFI